jgi:hypothetical protein
MNVILLNIILACMFTGNTFFSTNYIGLNKSEIEETVKLNQKSLRLNSSVTNTSYKYLKFEDKINEITVLFFLDEQDNCKLVRLMSDYSNINDMLLEINALFKSISKNNWQFSESNKVYNVNLEEGDWFYTITIKEND